MGNRRPVKSSGLKVEYKRVYKNRVRFDLLFENRSFILKLHTIYYSTPIALCFLIFLLRMKTSIIISALIAGLALAAPTSISKRSGQIWVNVCSQTKFEGPCTLMSTTAGGCVVLEKSQTANVTSVAPVQKENEICFFFEYVQSLLLYALGVHISDTVTMLIFIKKQ